MDRPRFFRSNFGKAFASGLITAPLHKWALASVVAGAVAWCGPAAGQSGAAEDPISPVVQFDDPASFRPGGTADLLRARVAGEGKATLLIELKGGHREEHRLSPGGLAAQRRELRSRQDAVVARVFTGAPARVERFTFIPYMTVDVGKDELERLLRDPTVASVHEEARYYRKDSVSARLINADDVLRLGRRGAGWTIAVIDTGVDRIHRLFRPDKVVAEACFSRQNPPQSISLCPDHVDGSTKPGSGEDCPYAGCSHGTHVASIAAGNAFRSIYGVALDAKVISIQVFERDTQFRIYTNDTNMLKALQHVYSLRAEHRIAAVNMSVGSARPLRTPCDAAKPAMTKAIQTLRSAGIPTIAAAGNEDSLSLVAPACITAAVAVGNSTNSDVVGEFSNLNNSIAFMAPGTGIVGAIPGGGFARFTGTSQATPHVAGAFALLRDSRDPANAATVAKVLNALTCSGKPITRAQPHSGDPVEVPIVRPRIDVRAAYEALFGAVGAGHRWDFQVADDGTDWARIDGVWNVAATMPGFLAMAASPTPGPRLAVVPNCATSYRLDIRFQRVDPTPFLVGTVFWFNLNIDYAKHLLSGYAFIFDKAVDGSTNKPGRVTVARYTNYEYRASFPCTTTNSCSIITLCASKPVPILPELFHAFRVDANNGTFNVYFDNQRFCSFVDRTFTQGSVGAYTNIRPSFHAGQIFLLDIVRILKGGTRTGDLAAN